MTKKELVKKILGKKVLYKIGYSKKIQKVNKHTLIKSFLKIAIFNKYSNLFKKVKIELSNKNFAYSIDIYKTYYANGTILGNLTIDYSYILNNSLTDFKRNIKNMDHNNYLYKNITDLLNGINILLDREIKLFKNNNNIVVSLNGIRNRKANSFADALQRILFYNQILWQTNHNLNGLGRLDVILDYYYKKDLKSGKITQESAKNLIKEFLMIMNKNYYFKSSALPGDTGQIIILGGKDINNKYFCNELTYMFIDAVKELKSPDPKVLLRVSKDTPRELLDKSLECISTGIGCPLFANDDIIIDKLIDFGYDKKDVYNYGTSACWEPFIIGKSIDQNNVDTVVFIRPLENLLNTENLEKINDFNELINIYYEYLKKYIDDLVEKNNKVIFANDAILSLLSSDCIKKGKDISKGGTTYNHLGFTGTGLSNTINSFIIINKYVYANKKISLSELNNIRKNNFKAYDDLLNEIKNNEKKYGVDDENIISLVNSIIRKTTYYLKDKNNSLGGKYKFGLSSPSYIMLSKDFPATFDGRKDGEPFGVHISSDKSNGYTELINFASKLDYGENRFNGNVVDFFVTPNFIEDNFEKFVDFIQLSIKKGFFEMQMNVVGSKQLIEARNNPEKYPNLIVRVWGFSSYFNDLPDEYKDYLIERALKNEGNY